MKTLLFKLVRIWGTGLAMLWLTMLALGIVFAPAWLILWGLRAAQASSDMLGWTFVAYCFVCAPFLSYHLGRVLGVRPRLLDVYSRNLKA